MARCMLLEAGLSPTFWAEAVSTATYIRNRCPSRSINGNTPHEIWTGKIPTAIYFQVFGSKAYMLNKTTKGKFSSRSIECVFIGYATETKAYRLWDPKTRKVRVSRDVKFVKNLYPGKDVDHFIDDSTSENHTKMDTSKELPAKEMTIAFTKRRSEDGNSSSEDEESMQGEKPQDDVHEEQVMPRLKIGPGRPQKIRTGLRGRPRIQPNLVPVIERDRQNDVQYQQENQEDEFHDARETVNLIEESDPKTVTEALSTPEATEWKQAIMQEYQALTRNGTWVTVDRPKNKKVIGSRWVLKTKYQANGEIERRKARLVAKGFAQECEVDFHETFSPVTRASSIRTVMALAAELGLEVEQLDFVSAYLNGDLDEEVFMEFPEGLPMILEESGYEKISENKVCLLKKAIYGLKQSGRQWFIKLDQKLRELEMTPSAADPCLYFHKDNGKLTIILIYVDDLIIASNNIAKTQNLKESLSKAFQMKDLGRIHYCLGIEFSQDRITKMIRMTQSKYIEDLLRRFNMEHCKPAATPLNSAIKLSKGMSPKTEKEKEDASKIPYRRLIGSLMYLATYTRPDIGYAVSSLSQFNEGYGIEHWKAAKRVVRYLKGTQNVGISFSKTGQDLIGFSDADWGASTDDRRSYSGYAFKLANGAISWSSRKQKTVALSSVEAEYMALSETAKEVIYLQRLLCELLGKTHTVKVFCDNQSAGLLAKNPVFHERTKHIDIRHNFVRDVIHRKEMEVVYIPTDQMPADVLTKGLSAQKHERCVKDLGLK